MPDEGYRWTVSAFKEHILAGTSTRACRPGESTFPAPDGGFPIYRRLRVTNPAPYMFFVRMLGMELAGSSPEPLVRVEGRRVSARPIAGTRPRGQTEIRDRLLEHELLADPKEQAEHAMLVDLARNDLGRVCVAGLGPADRADGGRAVHQGDAHRLDGRGRAPRGPPSARRPGGDVPGGHRDRRAEAPGDGVDRRARADRARPVRGRGRLPHVRRRPRLLHHDPDGRHRRRSRVGADGRRRGRRLRPRDRAPGDEGEGRRRCSRRSRRRRYADGAQEEPA